MATDLAERERKLTKRIEQLTARRDAVHAKRMTAERKKRTRELIQIGALLEHYCTKEDIGKLKKLTPEQKEKFFKTGFKKFLDEMFPDAEKVDG